MPQILRTHAPTEAPPLEDERDDAILVAEAKRDRRAFAPLYRRYVDRVYRYCDRVLGDRELAEDAASLVFTKALAGLPHCRGAAFRSWLFAIAHNVIVDAQRARMRTRPLADRVFFESGVTSQWRNAGTSTAVVLAAGLTSFAMCNFPSGIGYDGLAVGMTLNATPTAPAELTLRQHDLPNEMRNDGANPTEVVLLTVRPLSDRIGTLST